MNLVILRSPRRAALALVIVGVAIGALAIFARDRQTPFRTTSTNPRIQRAYEIARTIPDVLKGIPCHCGCMRSKLAHSNNLDCFKTAHGENCWQCVAIAHDVDYYVKRGASEEWIRRYVTNVYTFQLAQ